MIIFNSVDGTARSVMADSVGNTWSSWHPTAVLFITMIILYENVSLTCEGLRPAVWHSLLCANPCDLREASHATLNTKILH